MVASIVVIGIAVFILCVMVCVFEIRHKQYLNAIGDLALGGLIMVFVLGVDIYTKGGA